MKGINIFLADGFEDVEALCTCDVLRRGGVCVRLVSISGNREVESSHGVRVLADCLLDDLDASHEGTSRGDFMIFPGGMPGTRNLACCSALMSLMQEHYDASGSLAAICAAPGLVLGQLRSLEGVSFTCFDGFEQLPVSKGATFLRKACVVSDRIITGRSAGHAQAFGLEILRSVAGSEIASDVEHSMNLDTI